MIGFLQGEVKFKDEKSVILFLKQGIGYKVFVPKNLLEGIGIGEEISLFIHHNVKEDAQDLYGFRKAEDLTFFMQLLGINGIGPKAGMEILSLPSEEVKSAISLGNEAYIKKISGIGTKTAQRIILELKDRVSVREIGTIKPKKEMRHHEETLEALIKLGYGRKEVLEFLEEFGEESQRTEELITKFLKQR